MPRTCSCPECNKIFTDPNAPKTPHNHATDAEIQKIKESDAEGYNRANEQYKKDLPKIMELRKKYGELI